MVVARHLGANDLPEIYDAFKALILSHTSLGAQYLSTYFSVCRIYA